MQCQNAFFNAYFYNLQYLENYTDKHVGFLNLFNVIKL